MGARKLVPPYQPLWERTQLSLFGSLPCLQEAGAGLGHPLKTYCVTEAHLWDFVISSTKQKLWWTDMILEVLVLVGVNLSVCVCARVGARTCRETSVRTEKFKNLNIFLLFYCILFFSTSFPNSAVEWNTFRHRADGNNIPHSRHHCVVSKNMLFRDYEVLYWKSPVSHILSP